ncbi:MAG: di-trans,poly-cis-decaprenylcistransferase [Candidatus Woykebacteria bacterium RBG_16_43_9]|uniref:Isoprenyl transferase n=1 Tax=Candidatus Woykebacteria bacterium RBG_16_43_9 TaxID=1802596 RepID=A0A1G1WBA2_9BACT|nr:MAG: di-trans,poly-cis-decaprenylcistransferase [Candidatus Woykebacteria bacterium RBG_16_43_9]
MSKTVPKHVAIIMDGNRRWASSKKLTANKGHEAGVESLEVMVKAAAEFGIKYLTVYALSTENLRQRSLLEMRFLFSLIKKGLEDKSPSLDKNGVHLRFLGDIAALPTEIQKSLKEVEQKLSKNKRIYLNIALNYGGRDEIVQAVKKANKQTSKIETKDIEANLYTDEVPDPDLIIRTGGQKRLSNFLLWQSAYAELLFTDTLWPDFGKNEFKKALTEYSDRIRNFGR